MVTFYIVLRDETVVLDSGFVQKVCCVGFLEQGIADVFLVAQDLVDGASLNKIMNNLHRTDLLEIGDGKKIKKIQIGKWDVGNNSIDYHSLVPKI